jgi:hypothetical protein
MKKIYVLFLFIIATFAMITLSACNPLVKPSEPSVNPTTFATSIEYVRLHSTTLLGTVVTVEGTVICIPGEISSYWAYIQNGNYGILIDGDSSSATFTSLKRGDKVEIRGVVDKPKAGYIEIGKYGEAAVVTKLLGTTTPPSPTVVTVNDLKTNLDIQGTLIELKDVSLKDPTQWPKEGKSANVTLEDDSGNTVTMRIDSDTNIDGSATPTGSFDVVGVASYYYSPQILPRDLNDIVTK